MSPYERMAETYRLRPEAHPFESYVLWHHQRGFVFSTPDFFVMGFPCSSEVLQEFPSEPAESLCRAGNCWYVSACAGDMTKAWEILPWELPFIAFHRDNEGAARRHAGKRLQVVPLRRIRGLTQLP